MKPKEETKPTEDKSNNQPRAKIIFDELFNKRKELMRELHDSVDYNNLKFEFKISLPTWNDEFKLPDGSYSVPDIQDYFQFMLKRTWRRY